MTTNTLDLPDSAVAQFRLQGSALIAPEDVPLTKQEWRQLESICQQVTFEKVIGGDTGDEHSVKVGRFINDVKRPVSHSENTPKLLAVLLNDKMRAWFGQFVGTQKLCLRRCQVNKMNAGDFIGYHVDQDTTPDYHATFVFHLPSEYQGGLFVTYNKQGCPTKYRGYSRSVMINSGKLPHEVLPVTEGSRKTLACFFSTHFGDTTKPRQVIQTETECA